MELKELEEKYFFKTYKRLDLLIERGEGCWLITKSGEKYLDLFGGLAVNALGYNHPAITKAIEEQIRKYTHLSNYFLQEPQIKLAQLLIQVSGFNKIFFSNSGTEAMEGAIKLARKWGAEKNKFNIISFDNSFHGRTLGSLSITGREKYRKGYEPFLPNCIQSKFNDPDELIKKVDESTLAIVLEFIQGEGGIVEVDSNFLKTIANLRDKYNFLVIADEIQSGIGRTGKFFAFEHYNFKPDICVIAKPIGGGLPLGALLGNEKVANVFTYGVHGTTFGGNPVACAAGEALINQIKEKNLVDNAKQMGDYFQEGLKMLQNKFPNLIRIIRGKGLMIGIEMSFKCENIVAYMLQNNVLVNCTNENVIRLLPPLIINKEEIDFALEKFEYVLKNLKD
ncbi:MAG: Acetylornithine aminotransferase [Ignavibacteriae bacterium]|nr:MAG: Acetylornithine aminotransferase [Ignavibacteriota bacterium]